MRLIISTLIPLLTSLLNVILYSHIILHLYIQSIVSDWPPMSAARVRSRKREGSMRVGRMNEHSPETLLVSLWLEAVEDR